MARRLTLVAGLAALVAVTGCSRYARVPLDLGPILQNHPSPRDTSDVVRVVTYNIEFNRKIDLAGDELTSIRELRGADVYLLQEVDLEGTRELARRLGCSFVYDPVVYHPRSAGGFWGNAILSPYRLSEPWTAELPGHRSVTDRRMVGCTLHHPSGDIAVGSLHAETSVVNLAFWGGGQADQWRFAAKAMEEHVGDRRAIIGGDFNSAPFLPLVMPTVKKLDDIFAHRGFARLTPGDEPTGRGYDHRLDHVFGRGFDVSTSGVYIGAEASDHFPVWTRLVLSP